MSESKSLWGLRLLALVLAVAAWFVFTLEKREQLSEKVIEAPVRYENHPGLVLLDRVEAVRVGVRGPVDKLRNLNPFVVDVFVEIPNPAKGLFEIPLSASNVFLPQDLEVVSIEPNVIRCELDREVTQLLPVQAKLEGEPAAGAKARAPIVSPDRVLVRGPESRIRDIGSLYTSPIDLTGHALDFEEQAAVLPPDPLITVVQPAIVMVRIPMEIPGAGNQGNGEAGSP